MNSETTLTDNIPEDNVPVQSNFNIRNKLNSLTPDFKKDISLSKVFSPWMIIITVLLLICIICLTFGATSAALYNKIPDGSMECKTVFDVATQNTLLSLGAIGTIIFGAVFYKNYKICYK